jgi:preprotein translocase subunit SecE
MAQAAKTAKATGKPGTAGKPNVFARLRRYVSDVKAEMKRVVWPSRKEIINSSGIVIVTLVIFIIMISLYDQFSVFLVGVLGKIGG